MNDDILKELKEQTKWLRFLSFSKLKKIIEKNLTTKQLKIMYSLTDGNNSTREISKKLSIEGIKTNHMTVYNYWKKWNVLGIVIRSEEHQGRFEKIIDLEELDIK